MDLSMQKTCENNLYRHKKFDQGKRRRDGDVFQDLEQLNRARTSLTNAFLLNSYFYGVERVSTPFSTDSNCSSDYMGFVSRFNASSTPCSKRRRLLSGGQYRTSNPSEDSGISITPRKQKAADESLPREQLKRQLKPSSLALSPKQKSKIENVIDGVISAKQNFVTPTVRHNSNSNGISAVNITPLSSAINVYANTSGISTGNNLANKINETALYSKSVSTLNANSIKAVLKPTEFGTLELPTTATHTAINSDLGLEASVVLSRISKDKLRNICTYHTNMVRKFPEKQRSPKDQERRNKNTIACRMSRRVKKLEQIALEEECKELERQEQIMMEDVIRATAYLEQLELLMANIHITEDEDTEIDVVNVDDESDASASVTKTMSILNNEPGDMHSLPQTINLPSNSARSSAFTIASLLGNTK